MEKQAYIPVHKMVYMAWVDNIEENQQINYKDDNKKIILYKIYMLVLKKIT